MLEINSDNNKERLVIIIMATIGTLATHLLSKHLQIDTVTSASIVGIISGLTSYILAKEKCYRYSEAIYCGTFTGMTSLMFFTNGIDALIAGIVTGIVFVLSLNIFKGFGGKLGSIAFLSVFISIIILNKWTIINDLQTQAVTRFSYDDLVILFFVSLIGISLTYYFAIFADGNSVLSSSLLSLAFVLVINSLFTPSTTLSSILPPFFMGATFVGMSSKKFLGNFNRHLYIAILYFAVYFLFINSFIGFGGKLGLMAFIAVSAVAF